MGQKSVLVIRQVTTGLLISGQISGGKGCFSSGCSIVISISGAFLGALVSTIARVLYECQMSLAVSPASVVCSLCFFSSSGICFLLMTNMFLYQMHARGLCNVER